MNCGHTAEEHSAIIARLWEKRFGTTPATVAERVEAELEDELSASGS